MRLPIHRHYNIYDLKDLVFSTERLFFFIIKLFWSRNLLILTLALGLTVCCPSMFLSRIKSPVQIDFFRPIYILLSAIVSAANSYLALAALNEKLCHQASSLLSLLSCHPSGNRAQPRFLCLAEVLEMTGKGKTFIYARIKDGTSPKQIQLGSSSMVWNEQGVIKWMEDQMASRWPSSGSFVGVRGRPRSCSGVFADDFEK